MKTVAEVLRGAVQVLDERGWCQNTFSTEGRVCAMGAMRLAAGSPIAHSAADIPEADWHSYLQARAEVESNLQLNSRITNLGDWNDRPGRTVDEVKAALLAAAERAEAGA